MKICLCTDIHWGRHSSIITASDLQYTTKLTGLLNSMNWVNRLAMQEKCQAVVCAGDFFNTTTLQADEATALKDIEWNELPWYFVCGNHEATDKALQYNLVNVLSTATDKYFRQIISSPEELQIPNENTVIRFLPYVTEDNRLALKEYFNKKYEVEPKKIIISHNEIAGINYGGFTSTAGFSIEEIEGSCDLYLNGHLHNSEWVSKKILNLGSLSAHNFTNDSSKYAYGAWILDTTDLSMTFYDNPYAFNFYKFVIKTDADINKLYNIKNHAVVSISCTANMRPNILHILEGLQEKLTCYKLTVTCEEETGMGTGLTTDELHVDHIQKFIEFIKEKLEISDIVEEELAQVCS